MIVVMAKGVDWVQIVHFCSVLGEFFVWLGSFVDANEGCVMNQNFLS